MTDHLKTIREALEILHHTYLFDHQEAFEALDALEAAMREPCGEVSGYYERGFDERKTLYGKLYNQDLPIGIKLFAAPPAQQAQPSFEEKRDAMKQAITELRTEVKKTEIDLS